MRDAGRRDAGCGQKVAVTLSPSPNAAFCTKETSDRTLGYFNLF